MDQCKNLHKAVQQKCQKCFPYKLMFMVGNEILACIHVACALYCEPGQACLLIFYISISSFILRSFEKRKGTLSVHVIFIMLGTLALKPFEGIARSCAEEKNHHGNVTSYHLADFKLGKDH